MGEAERGRRGWGYNELENMYVLIMSVYKYFGSCLVKIEGFNSVQGFQGLSLS